MLPAAYAAFNRGLYHSLLWKEIDIIFKRAHLQIPMKMVTASYGHQ